MKILRTLNIHRQHCHLFVWFKLHILQTAAFERQPLFVWGPFLPFKTRGTPRVSQENDLDVVNSRTSSPLRDGSFASSSQQLGELNGPKKEPSPKGGLLFGCGKGVVVFYSWLFGFGGDVMCVVWIGSLCQEISIRTPPKALVCRMIFFPFSQGGIWTFVLWRLRYFIM